MAAPLSTSGIGTPEKHTACIDCGIRLVSGHYYRWNMPADEKIHHGTQFGIHVGGGRCGKCWRRHRRGGQIRNAPDALTTCPHCEATTATSPARAKMSAAERARTERRVKTDGTCGRCYDRLRAGSAPGPRIEHEPIAYEGGWVRRGLILVPVKRGAA